MASKDTSGASGAHSPRKSIIGFFKTPETDEPELGDPPAARIPTYPSKRKQMLKFLENLASPNPDPSTAAPPQTGTSLAETLRRGWPPSIPGRKLIRLSGRETSLPVPPSFRPRISDLYRAVGDGWASGATLGDLSADVKAEFDAASMIMDEVGELAQTIQNGTDSVAEILLCDMASVVYGSNTKARRGLNVQYNERTPEYQAKLEKLIRKDINPGDNHVIRSRREVVQHAAAFQHLVNEFVHNERPMTEKLIKETHAILVKGVSSAGAGFLDTSKEFGGVYRTDDVYIGVQRCPRPSEILAAMTSMVKNLGSDLDAAEKLGTLDPFALAAKYCDRFVNIHLFRDGNDRMCRLILNVILIKYAGIVVNVGEHDQSRDEYLSIAQESRAVGGHAGPLATLVLKEAHNTLRRMRDTLRKTKNWSAKRDLKGTGKK